jgi:hypothetical protein
MKRLIIAAVAAAFVLILGVLPASAQQRIRTGLSFDYGTATSAFGLSSPPAFDVPFQNNSSSDAVISADLEYLLVRELPLDVGLEIKGSFGISSWDLGSPGVFDAVGNYYLPDDVFISSPWWAAAAMATAHLHLGRFITLDGALGYGPFGYFDVSYWDDAGVVAGPVVQGAGVFPPNAWGVDWSTGLSFGVFRLASVSLEAGMMGPDFVAGLGVSFRY